MHSIAFEIFLRVLLLSIKEGRGGQVGRNRIVRSIVDSGGNSLEAVQLIGMGINVVDIFGCCGAVQGDWNLEVPVEAGRNRLLRLWGGGGFRNMPTVRSICPSFLGTLILATLPASLPVLTAVLGGVNVSFDSGGLLLTVLLDVV